MKRKIAAILAADVAEYSRLVAEDEEDTVRRLVAAQAVFKESVASHHGRIFNTAGDAILAEFASAVEAARSAIDIQERMDARNKAYPASRQLAFRIGLSIGDVAEHGSDLLGDGVNIAARLQTLAPPGGLAISQWVQEQTAGKLTVNFKNIGNQSLKNIPAPVNVFIADLQAAGPAAPIELPASPGTWSSKRTTVFVASITAVIAIAMVAVALQRSPQPSPMQPPSAKTAIEPAPLPPSITEPQKASAPPAVPPSIPAPPDVVKSSPALIVPTPVPDPPRTEKTLDLPTPPQPPVSPPVAPTIARPPPKTAAPALSPKRQPQSCAEVLERAQLGDLTADDREFLRTRCR